MESWFGEGMEKLIADTGRLSQLHQSSAELRTGFAKIAKLTSEHRSWNMGRISSGNTKPELAVRSLLHKMGYRFRLHRKDLPGKPDIILPKHKAVVFVHGCFWHRHDACQYAYTPKSRVTFWEKKFKGNIERDNRNKVALEYLGWKVIVIWECELSDLETLSNKLRMHINMCVSRNNSLVLESKII
jgi:DNA mismatch endonuclease, patch repair protein